MLALQEPHDVSAAGVYPAVLIHVQPGAYAASRFLPQLYCPIEERDDCFHRTIYVFCCNEQSCQTSGATARCVGETVLLRCRVCVWSRYRVAERGVAQDGDVSSLTVSLPTIASLHAYLRFIILSPA